jgi:hypothetical protein
MSAFPTLKTGAVTQYPAQRGVAFSTVALQFVDGSEQRFRNYPAPLRRWVIQLALLDQAEMHQLQEFFRNVAGPAGTFSFTDPLDGLNYSNCSMESDSLTGVLASEWNGQTAVTIVENRG